MNRAAMWKSFIFPIYLSLLLFFLDARAQVQSSFRPGQVWKDDKGQHINAHGGGILFFSGRYYWYGEHKIAGPIGNTAQVGFHCYSSADLYNWKDEGIALKVSEDTASEIRKGSTLERPKVIYNEKTKTFVMWFHLEQAGRGYHAARCGIARSKTPAGPFIFLRSERPDAGSWPLNAPAGLRSTRFRYRDRHFTGGVFPESPDTLNLYGRDFSQGQMSRDMNLFVDDDKKAYLIYTSEENSTIHISRLSDDYLGHAGAWVRVFSGGFNEGPALFKNKGHYYLVTSGCTGWAPNAARSAVADHIFGPWKKLGNPAAGPDSETTFHSQSTFVFPVEGKKNSFIYMGDRWAPENPVDGSYVWLPVEFTQDAFHINYRSQWKLDFFDQNLTSR